MIEHTVAFTLAQGVALGALEVLVRHLRHQVGERYLRLPAQLLARLARVAEQGLDLGGPKISRIDGDDATAGAVITAFVDALAFPLNLHIERGSGGIDEVAAGG